MPVLRSPFEILVTPGKPCVLDASQSGASFTLFMSGITPVKRNFKPGEEEEDEEAKPGFTTVYLQTSQMQTPLAIGSVEAERLYTDKVRVTLPVHRGAGPTRIMVVGPEAVTIHGDQHTVMSREQVDAIGFRAEQEQKSIDDKKPQSEKKKVKPTDSKKKDAKADSKKPVAGKKVAKK